MMKVEHDTVHICRDAVQCALDELDLIYRNGFDPDRYKQRANAIDKLARAKGLLEPLQLSVDKESTHE